MHFVGLSNDKRIRNIEDYPNLLKQTYLNLKLLFANSLSLVLKSAIDQGNRHIFEDAKNSLPLQRSQQNTFWFNKILVCTSDVFFITEKDP